MINRESFQGVTVRDTLQIQLMNFSRFADFYMVKYIFSCCELSVYSLSKSP